MVGHTETVVAGAALAGELDVPAAAAPPDEEAPAVTEGAPEVAGEPPGVAAEDVGVGDAQVWGVVVEGARSPTVLAGWSAA